MASLRDYRVEQVAEILRAGNLVTADGIADRLKISVRTVYRYIKHLQRCGLPIQGEGGIGYMYRESPKEAAR